MFSKTIQAYHHRTSASESSLRRWSLKGAGCLQVEYDPKECSYESLLDAFFAQTDPTTVNQQGNDMGSQYRSGIYYYNDAQKAIGEKVSGEACDSCSPQVSGVCPICRSMVLVQLATFTHAVLAGISSSLSRCMVLSQLAIPTNAVPAGISPSL